MKPCRSRLAACVSLLSVISYGGVRFAAAFGLGECNGSFNGDTYTILTKKIRNLSTFMTHNLKKRSRHLYGLLGICTVHL